MKKKIWRDEKSIKSKLTPIEKMDMIFKWIDISCNKLNISMDEDEKYMFYEYMINNLDIACYMYVYENIKLNLNKVLTGEDN